MRDVLEASKKIKSAARTDEEPTEPKAHQKAPSTEPKAHQKAPSNAPIPPKDIPQSDDTRPSELETKPSTLPASISVIKKHAVVRIKPSNKVRRRAVVMKGARLPVSEETDGPGCRGKWFKVMKEGWLCEDDAPRSSLPPLGLDYPVVPEGQITPWPYGFVRTETLEYRMSGDALEEVRELLKGFGFGIETTVRLWGNGFFRTAEGTLVPRKDAGITGRVSKFEGLDLSTFPDRNGPVGFVFKRKARVWSEPARLKKNRLGTVERYKAFEVQETVGKGRRKFYRFDEGAWLAASDVRIMRPAPLPKGIDPGEKWIDVDTKSQILTAYEGEKPVFTTLVSSGRGNSPTVRGEYRIWAKIAAIAMDNTDDEQPEPASDTEESEDLADMPEADTDTEEEKKPHLYSLHDVPWTQFFFESFALHGVYWHDAFGNRRSHGCVNLSPKDAARIYNWTEPRIPKGFWAVHTTKAHPGTLIRIR